MRFAIACDLEGIAGVVGRSGQGLGMEGKLYERACVQAVKEINAAARALFDNDAKEVYVWDNHGGSLNLEYDLIDERCDIIAGTGAAHRWPGIDEPFDGFLLIGYHANADTADSILAHSYSSTVYQYIKINGKAVGEMQIDAAVAAERTKTPVIFVSSDDKGTNEAKRFMPWIETVTTKKSLGRNLAVLKHPKKVETMIYESVVRSVKRLAEMQLFTFEKPLLVELRFMRLEQAENQYKKGQPNMERIDPYTVSFSVDSILDMY